jgi:hypothetical protein
VPRGMGQGSRQRVGNHAGTRPAASLSAPARGLRQRMLLRTSAAAVAAVAALSIVGVAPAGARETGPPNNTAAPTIAGAPMESKKLKAARGTWTGASPFRYSYAWSRCSTAGTECQTISGATKTSYKPVGTDVGHRLLVTVKATNKEGAGEASSSPSAVVAPAAPKRKKPPTISGEAVDGRVLTVS